MALYAFDGTWNTDDPDPQVDTNVVRFMEAYQRGAAQTKGVEYIEGVGTRMGFLGKVFGGVTGAGGRERIEEMYAELEDNYNDGDQNIDIIGFSRGAALAVHFANVIVKKGIRSKAGKKIIPRIRFLGVWDIVASFGMPLNFILPFQELNIGWSLTVPKQVDHCFHAMALHERRQTFVVTRLNEGNRHSHIQELWFRGVHSDVGGGNRNTPLSSIGLQWMLEKARACGLPIRATDIRALKAQQDPYARLGDNMDFKLNPPRTTHPGDHFHATANQVVLPPGKSRTFSVKAADLYSWSKVRVVAGGKYRFEIAAGQKWTDGEIRCGPDGWKTKDRPLVQRPFFRVAETRRRHRQADWFELIGTLGRNDDQAFRLYRESRKSRPWVAPMDGDLYAFANDIGRFYRNNKGSIRVKVHRVA